MDPSLGGAREAIKKVLIAGILIVGLESGLIESAAAQTPPSLPAKAQQAMDKGLTAARQQDFKAAVDHFTEAFKAVRFDTDNIYPQIYFNLGLAESKVPHHELPAICWLNAYLIASRNASNRTQVRAEIEALKARFRNVLRSLADHARQMIPNLPEHYRPAKYWGSVENFALAGDMDTAKQMIAEHKMTYQACSVGSNLALAGDVGRALELVTIGWPAVAGKKDDKSYCCHAYDYIAAKMAEQEGDAGNAKSLLGYCTDDENRTVRPSTLTSIALVELKAGKKEDAERKLQRARDIIGRSPEPISWKDQEYWRMGDAQARAGEFEAAQRTASLISDQRYDSGVWKSGREYKEKISQATDRNARSNFDVALVFERLYAGDFNGAARTAGALAEDKHKRAILDLIEKCRSQPDAWERYRIRREVYPWTFLAEFQTKTDIKEELEKGKQQQRPDDILDWAAGVIKNLSRLLIEIEVKEREWEREARKTMNQ